MKVGIRLMLVVCGLLLVIVSATDCRRPPDATAPRVVVLCVEALRHDYPEWVAMPQLERLAAAGGRARALVPVFPTNSVPNMAAIATGTVPAKSGMVNNLFFLDRARTVEFDAEAEAFRVAQVVEPIWVTAVRQSVPAAAINWIAAEVPFEGTSPSRRSRLDEDASDDDRVAELERWLADRRADAPRLMLIYLDELDDVAHDYGPDDEETLRAVERVDVQIGRIADAIARDGGAERTTLFVVADHGMANVRQCIYLQEYLRRLGFGARTLSSGAVSNVYLDAGIDPREVQTALRSQDDTPYSVYLPAEVPQRYGFVFADRVGDLVMVGEKGTYFRDREGRDNPVGPARLPGMHGFPPEQPDMQGTFVAWGRGVPSGQRWDDVTILDVYPTVCRLLGLEPVAEHDGAPLPGIEPPVVVVDDQ